MTYKLKKDDYVRVRLAGDSEWCAAIVAVASETDPQSVGLALEGCVRHGRGGVILKTLPLAIDYTAGTVTSLFGDEYEIEVASFQATFCEAAS